MSSTERHELPRTLVALPLEIVGMIIENLTPNDYAALSIVNKDFNAFFRQEEISKYAHRIYFPTSAAIVFSENQPEYRSHVRFEKQSERTGEDFRSTLRFFRRWMGDTPSSVTFIDDLTNNTTISWKGFLVDEDEGVLVYRKTYEKIVIKDLNRPLEEGFPTTTEVNLLDIPDVVSFLRNLRNSPVPGAALGANTMRLDQGCLFIIVEPVDQSNDIRSRAISPAHVCCAISTRPQNRGELLCSWTQEKNFILHTAHNSHYAIAEFGLMEQALDGVVYSQIPGETTPVATFTLEKRMVHTARQNMSRIAPDEDGRVFYMAYMQSIQHKPIVEVYGIPQLQDDGSYSPLQCIKRVILRCAPFWTMSAGVFNRITQRCSLKLKKAPKARARAWGTDGIHSIQFVLSGTFRLTLHGETRELKSISWYITEKPSPRLPSNTRDYKEGKVLAKDEVDDEGVPITSCFIDDKGNFDFSECYPKPWYLVIPKQQGGGITSPSQLELLPSHQTPPDRGFNLNREIHAGRLHELNVVWEMRHHSKPYSIRTVYCERAPVIDNTILPLKPGVDDEDFAPVGEILYAKYVHRITIGRYFPDMNKRYTVGPTRPKLSLFSQIFDHLRQPEKVFMPFPTQRPNKKTTVSADRSGDHRWIVYGSNTVHLGEDVDSENVNERIVILRFD